MIEGIDVSRWQGEINWHSVKLAGKQFAAIKLGGCDTGRVYRDSYAAVNFRRANMDEGIATLGYWYFDSFIRLDVQMAFIKVFLEELGNALSTRIVVIDIEGSGLLAEDIERGIALAQMVKDAGYRPMIYTGAWCWNVPYAASTWRGKLIPFDLWAATYSNAVDIPHGWADFTLWQYTNKGRVPGILGDVDLDKSRDVFWLPREGETQEDISVAQYKIVATALNIRPTPIAVGTPLGQLKEGQQVEADPPVNGWHRLNLGETTVYTAGGAPFTPTNGRPRLLPDQAYISAAWTTPLGVVIPPPPPPPAQTSKLRLGVHVIGDHGAATNYLGKGAPAVTMMHGKLEAVQRAIAFPNALVVYRAWFGFKPTLAQWLGAMGPSPNDPPLAFVGSNEGDVEGELEARAKWDYQCATSLKMRQPNARYVAMTASHGNPDVTNPAIMDIVRRLYAPHYNSGLFDYVDVHNYTFQKSYAAHPPADARMIGAEWFERRADYFLKEGEFDPTRRGLCSTEGGVEAGHGGFRWAGYSQAQFAEWLANHIKVMEAPITVGGVTYPSPYDFETLFMAGSDGNWSGGYGVDALFTPGIRRLRNVRKPTAKELASTRSLAKYVPRAVWNQAMNQTRDLVEAPPELVHADDYSIVDYDAELVKLWAK